MTWIKLDDQAVDHPKLAGLSDRTFRWWIRGLSYASRYLTDGVLPRVFVRTVPARSVAELFASALWTARGDEALIHDYLDHQTPRALVTQKREQARARAQKVRGNFLQSSQKVSEKFARSSRKVSTKFAESSRKVCGKFPESSRKPVCTEVHTDTEVQYVHPLTPSHEGAARLTRLERKWAEDVRRIHGCPHTPACGDRYTCLGLLVGQKRDAERQGLAQAARK